MTAQKWLRAPDGAQHAYDSPAPEGHTAPSACDVDTPKALLVEDDGAAVCMVCRLIVDGTPESQPLPEVVDLEVARQQRRGPR